MARLLSWRLILALVGGVALLILVGGLGAGLGPFGGSWHPFSLQHNDRSKPVVLRSIQDLSLYIAAAGDYQVIIDLEEDVKYVPSFILGSRVLFVAEGVVDASVDFGAVTGDAVEVSGKAVTVRLPEPRLQKPKIDHEKSYVHTENRGLLNRLRDAVANDPNRVQRLNTLAEEKIAKAARESDLAARARENTRATLTSLLGSLGFEKVEVSFT